MRPEEDFRHELLALGDKYFALTIRVSSDDYIVAHATMTLAQTVRALENRLRGDTLFSGIPYSSLTISLFSLGAAAERYATTLVRDWVGLVAGAARPDRLILSSQILLTVRAGRRVNWGERPADNAPAAAPAAPAAAYGSPLGDFHRRRLALSKPDNVGTTGPDRWARFELAGPSDARPTNMTLRPITCEGVYYLPLEQYETDRTVEVLLPPSCAKTRTTLATEHGGSNGTDSHRY
jgi:hypothetical protein